MTRTLNFNHPLVTFGLPATIILSMVLLAQSAVFHTLPKPLSAGITLDLILTAPVVYFLLIRKKNIPKLTVVPVFIIGILVASLIIPPEQQQILGMVKQWVLPVVELTVFSIIVFKVTRTIRLFRKQKGITPDFYDALQEVAGQMLPVKISGLFVNEISLIYYSLFSWRKRTLAANEYSYHKKSGTISLLAVFIFLILVETFVMHILLERWSVVAAWILSALSMYGVFQVFGFIRSMGKRPIVIGQDQLILRSGLFSEAIINFSDIDRIEMSRKRIELNDTTRKLSPLQDFETHNVILYLNNEASLKGFYGKAKSFRTIAFFVDDKEGFVSSVERKMIK